ncbi:MAG: polysaccharide deacetylase family protein [Nitrospiraceae bacterium]
MRSATWARLGLFVLLILIGAPPAVRPIHAGHADVITAGPSACRNIALTFDLCPVRAKPGFDAALIDYLQAREIPATFFVSGRWAEQHQDDVRALQAVPFFEIGTHGEDHAHLPLLDESGQRAEIFRAVSLMRSRYHLSAGLFRPPYGEYDDVTVQVVKSLGLQFILWNLVSGDPDPTLTANAILDRVVRRLRPGSIVVFHANGKGKHTREVIQALDETVLSHAQLRPVTVTDLLACHNPTR